MLLERRATTLFRSSTAAASTCWRLKASSCRVSAARALGGLLDLLDDRARSGSSARARSSEQLAVAEDDGEQVVEVVRDAAGEPADRLHLLRLAELLLEPFRSVTSVPCRRASPASA